MRRGLQTRPGFQSYDRSGGTALGAVPTCSIGVLHFRLVAGPGRAVESAAIFPVIPSIGFNERGETILLKPKFRCGGFGPRAKLSNHQVIQLPFRLRRFNLVIETLFLKRASRSIQCRLLAEGADLEGIRD